MLEKIRNKLIRKYASNIPEKYVNSLIKYNDKFWSFAYMLFKGYIFFKVLDLIRENYGIERALLIAIIIGLLMVMNISNKMTSILRGNDAA